MNSKATLLLLASSCLAGSILLTACNGSDADSPTVTPTPSPTPGLNQNALNFIFVPSFESNPDFNNLSVTGFNHSLLFGQLLNQLTASQVAGIYALIPATNLVNNYPDMKPLQSIENYAVLNTESITVSLSTIPSSTVNLIKDILTTSNNTNNFKGNYVFALPANVINSILGLLSVQSGLNFKYTAISNSNQYIIVTVTNPTQASVVTYNDGLVPSATFPQLNLPSGAQCQEVPFTITSTTTPPADINTNETVYFVRHVEAHPESDFENGNYVCQGQWRAIGAPATLFAKMGGLPDYVYSSDPSELIGTAFSSDTYSYVRPSLSVNPFTIKYNMPLNLVESSQFLWNNGESLANFLFAGGKFNGKTVLVSWEHGHIESTIVNLFKTLYGNSETIPTWGPNDYDTIWKVQLDSNGNATFSNTCEGIPESALANSCPTF
jgi:hypothetical protein